MTTLYLAKVVKAEKDEDKKHARINVKLHGFDGDPVIRKVRLLSFAASKASGAVWIPDVDDEVLVARLGGPHEWVALGSLYNGTNEPLYDNADGKNIDRVFTTPGGSELKFTEDDGAKSKKSSIRIATKEGTEILLTMDSGKELISINCKKDVKIKTEGDGVFEVDAGGDVTIKSGGATTVKSGGALTLEGTDVTIKGSSVKVDSGDIALG